MIERMSLLSESEVNKLHAASMKILRDVGIAFHEPEAVEVFKQRGVKTDDDVVFIEEQHVEAALESAPAQFQLNARNPEKSVTIGGEHLVIAPGYGSPFMVTKDGDQRDGVMEDYDNFCKLVHTSKTIDMNGCLMIDPSDREARFAHLDMILSNLMLCDKPFLGSSVSRQAANDSIRMAQIAWGGEEEIRNYPVMMAIISSLSPLQYSAEMTGALIEFARHGQANMVGLLMLAGATGPITLPGLLALQNAEMLAGITLAQFVNPGSPVVYGSTSTITDMRSGALSIGAPELSMIQKATIQMAKFYGLPSRGSGGLSDAHFPDMQAGVESTLALTITILSGANFLLHACGILGSYLGMSYEKFLVDEEICSMLRRMVKPLNVTDERIDMESIKSVGIGGEYLTHPKTYEHCRSEFYLPGLMNREDYAEWKDAGKMRLDERIAAKLAERFANYRKPDIDPAIERDLRQFVKKGYSI